MEFLFDFEINLNLNNNKFIIPSTIQINDWLKQTNGIYTKEICDYLNIKKDNCAKYSGSLTPAQQYWIITDLQN